MNKHPYWLLGITLAVGVTFDLLFWKQGYGVNFPLFWVIVLAGGIFLLLVNGIKPDRKTYIPLILFVFFANMAVLRSEPLSRFLSITFMIFTLFVIASTFENGKWVEFTFGNYCMDFMLMVAGVFHLPFSFIGAVRKEQREKLEQEGKVSNNIAGRVVIGVSIAVPIVLLLTSLLAMADSVFSLTLTNVFKNIGDLFVRFLLVILIAFAASSAYIFAGSTAQNPDRAANATRSGKHLSLLGIVESSIVLGSISLVFLVFVFIQFKYFFGGNVNIGDAGFTYSEYARRGFNELNWVAFLSLFIVVVLSLLTHRDTPAQRKVYTGFNLLVIGQVIIILVSAFQRLLLAIDWHGFSRLRVYPLIFMIWMALLLVGVALLELIRREDRFMLAIVTACVGFAVTVCAINVDGTITRYNVTRAIEGKQFNVPHLSDLSSDTVPDLVMEFGNPALPEEIHEGIGAALVCQQQRLENWSDERDWRSLDLSYILARDSLASVNEKLSGYEYSKNEDGNYVKTPGGNRHQCRESRSEEYRD